MSSVNALRRKLKRIRLQRGIGESVRVRIIADAQVATAHALAAGMTLGEISELTGFPVDDVEEWGRQAEPTEYRGSLNSLRRKLEKIGKQRARRQQLAVVDITNTVKTVTRALDAGMSPEEISELTGFPIDTVEHWRNS